ncbi:(2Fe-2S)-binding protein [Bacillus rubiinfantis]|uniref:(2Fe-2S)-binding protein n=1 Tax=Bacillus rubiinfantis TaxID=1499680 RepID=UPI0005A9CA8D|nr:(2Fe-2S)-binding protein [Bacillus rubiinfantis]
MAKKYPVRLKVNGKDKSAEIEPRLLLVHLLRDEFDFTGTHIGCDTSQCGACTVSLDGKAVKSCTVLAVQADGSEVTTVEGLGTREELHPIQQGFWERHGLQCGFCTPGVMMAVNNLLQENLEPTESEIREALDGVICRCTGYQFIVEAVQHASELIRKQQRQPVSTENVTAGGDV